MLATAPATTPASNVVIAVFGASKRSIDSITRSEDASGAANAAASPAPAPAAAKPAAAPAPAASGAGKQVASPLPGVIIDVNVNVGDAVKAGQQVAVLEAMKMENSIEASQAGTVTAVHVSKGDSVLEGAPIITIA